MLRWSPLQPMFQWRASRRLAVLAYHGIDDADRFASHLDHINRHAAPVSLDEVVDALEGGPMPRRAVLVTFDDGDRSVLSAARPLMQERSIPAVAFVVSGVLDTERPFWWDEAEALARAGGRLRSMPRMTAAALVAHLKTVGPRSRHQALEELRGTATTSASARVHLRASDLATLESAGIEVGNHTLDHDLLAGCDDTELSRQILGAHETIARALGHTPRAFAYPNGEWDQRAEHILRDAGYRAAFLFDHRLSRLGRGGAFRISRLRMDAGESLDRLRIVLSGLHPAVHRLRGGT